MTVVFPLVVSVMLSKENVGENVACVIVDAQQMWVDPQSMVFTQDKLYFKRIWKLIWT